MTKGPIFYVYEHWRPDRDMCFYVGKGHGRRATEMRSSRNKHHKAIQAKLAAKGMCVEVRLVADGLTEPQSLNFEIERIAFWRQCGVKLANQTDGGQGSSGRKTTPEENAKRSASLRGKVFSPERRAKISAAKTGIRHSEESRSKMSAAQKAYLAEDASRLGTLRLRGKRAAQNVTPETLEKRSKSLRGKKRTPEQKLRMSESQMGRVLSPEHIAKVAASKRGKKQRPETIAKRAASIRGQKRSGDVRARMSAAQKGRALSPEHREKLRLSWEKRRGAKEATNASN